MFTLGYADPAAYSLLVFVMLLVVCFTTFTIETYWHQLKKDTFGCIKALGFSVLVCMGFFYTLHWAMSFVLPDNLTNVYATAVSLWVLTKRRENNFRVLLIPKYPKTSHSGNAVMASHILPGWIILVSIYQAISAIS